jgi:hypothetical protein
MSTCPTGSKWSVTKSQCMLLQDYNDYLAQLIATMQWALVSQEQNADSTFDPFGLTGTFNKIKSDLKGSLIKIVAVGGGLVLIVVAAKGWLDEGKIKIDLPDALKPK